MKNYDNYFLPVDNMEEAKRYYEEILGLKKKFDFSNKGMAPGPPALQCFLCPG